MSNPTPYGSAGRAATPTPLPRAAQSPTPDSYEEILELGFVCRRKSRSILNSTVVGRDGYTPYFHIMTGLESTLFRTNDGRTVATIEWRGKGGEAFVEVRGAVSKQRVSQWLGVAEDARRVHAFMYHWNPAAAGNVPQLLARIEKEGRTVTLEVAVEAINRGLLEMAVVAATVFQSGCSIY
ncbi:hypothetical protein DFH08DRAFT_766839 [Mycena albidolilacea]|uniref:Uncharacterized protein n=1 Tax=Mycena albidolilacea TaxID=1033008 RepID=A0AAD7ALE1_9AGAR|nr:hypothetical protein DFH08DRAFT_766839 [Mycena albidolilacea]